MKFEESKIFNSGKLKKNTINRFFKRYNKIYDVKDGYFFL